jgi:transportin-1
LIQLNPSGATGGLSAFVEAVASWRGCRNEELVATMGQLVVGYKEHVGEQQWAMVMRDLEPGVVRKLAETYNV